MKRLTPLLLLSLFTFQFTLAQVATTFGEGAGEYKELFDHLRTRLLNSEYVKTVRLGGKERNVFVPWVRDHVHVMKAMKYFTPEISNFWQLYMERQTPEGLYFDYYYPIADHVNHRMNLFDKRYWRIFPTDSVQMHRLPVEADLEYLMVEGAYYIWQATGDNKYVSRYIQQLEKGMHYAMSDPLRWSKKHQLVKRGYTLDTWDFMQLPTTRKEYSRQGNDVQKGIFDIDENTPMGIMHGDNSGMYAACNQLSKMHAAIGNHAYADAWSKQADIFRVRTNALCWNGKFYVHFVEDDPMPGYLNIDQKNTLSLSNPYDINRGLPTREMALSIINTYQGLKENNKMNAFAEWFGIYPAVEPHFADYQPGSYMNGGVNTIVGGELAKAAFQNGAEAYGVDILKRMLQLVHKHKGDLPVSYRPDGAVDAGIPDNWGQAAVMSALVEGLAGIVDKGQLFRSVEISPRWVAAGKENVQVTVAYGPSQKAVSYHFQHSPGKRTLSLAVSGDAESYSIRMLLPSNHRQATAKLDKKAFSAKIQEVAESRYAVMEGIPKGAHTITLAY